MNRILVESAPAKINLALNIKKKREDGYHEMEMINFPVSLSDSLMLIPSDKYSLDISKEPDCHDRENLVTKVTEYLSKKFNKEPDFRFYLLKRIPEKAGLAGGSADAAAAIRLILKHWDKDEKELDFKEIAETIGADIPYCFKNSPALVTGIGENIEPIEVPDLGKIMIVIPDFVVSTPEAFSWVDEEAYQNCDTKKVLKLLKKSELPSLKGNSSNAFEKTIAKRYDQINDIIKKLYDSGAYYASLSGSGSAVIGYFKEDADTESLKKALTGYELIETDFSHET